jgi:tryptophan synthase alpha chain
MSNRIDQTIAKLSKNKQKILSPYLTAGDPTLELTVPLMHALVEGGADILELGIPFSDPMAEGPVIQHAMERALAQGVSVDDVFKQITAFRQKDNQTPIVIMGYLNPIEMYGYERFAKNANKAGVDGTILVDMPPEEAGEILPIWQQHKLHAILLCSPTTSDKRLNAIAEVASGYLYYVSLKGVTGASTLSIDNVRDLYQRRKQQVSLPLLVGFGIKTPEIAAEIASFADGVIVGAALIETVYDTWQAGDDPCAAAKRLMADMRHSMNAVES